ncbi:hypothetical protein BV22DRAFT_1195602 [Leucogyrophana mollusca]|uniref:Uncharacterized protein n=1 Tax=Leucogyrophana mollusca TaxID=85980 RepID=A0ACB8BHN3_9AGAM|nr:hypothetical protein BV22DRAFT_1195602 [Leucogyrophana mollusca]
MFHYPDRLAGLDDMVLQINTPLNTLSSAVSKRGLDDQPYINVKKVKTRKGRRASRPPLADKTISNNITTHAQSQAKTTCGEELTESQDGKDCNTTSRSRARQPKSGDHPFKPLPPVPSASTLQLPSFLNFSSQSSIRPAVPLLQQSSPALPPSILFQPSSAPRTTSRRRVVVRKSDHKKVHDEPLFIPAFHHPNSPYVPWASPVRRRILCPATPTSPTDVYSRPHSRSGARAPEPAESEAHSDPISVAKEGKFSSTWARLKKSVKGSTKAAVSRLVRFKKSSRSNKEPSHTCLASCKASSIPDEEIVFAENPSPSSHPPQCSRSRLIHTSLESFASSDSSTLAAWLATRRRASSETARDTKHEMSLDEYEVMGSWLDLSRSEGEWPCGVPDCDLHTPDGSPNAMCQGLKIFRTTMPFDRTDPPSTPVHIKAPSPSFSSDFHPTPSQFCSLPRLPSQCFKLKPDDPGHLTVPGDGHMLPHKRSRELSMPGGWTFTT